MNASVASNASEKDMIDFLIIEHLRFFYNIEQVYTELLKVKYNYGTFACKAIQIMEALKLKLMYQMKISNQNQYFVKNGEETEFQ